MTRPRPREARDEAYARRRGHDGPSRRWFCAGDGAGPGGHRGPFEYPALPAFSLPRPTRTVCPRAGRAGDGDHELPLVTCPRASAPVAPRACGEGGFATSPRPDAGRRHVALAPRRSIAISRARGLNRNQHRDDPARPDECAQADFGECCRCSRTCSAAALRPGRLTWPSAASSRHCAAERRSEFDRQPRVPRAPVRRDTPFARQVTYATLQGLSRDDLVAWHARYLHPEQTIWPCTATSRGGGAGGDHQGLRFLARGPKQVITFPEPRPQSTTGVFEAVRAMWRSPRSASVTWGR